MALAPATFGPFGDALLVGNNGDGRINAYDISSGAFLGQLADGAGNPIAINGLWGLTFGNDHLAGNSQTLFFAAGIDHEQHGLFGAIQNAEVGVGGTAGSLPYDPTIADDDYPLPPSRGPSLQGDSGQLSPTPMLMPLNHSSIALAPTLTLSVGVARSMPVSFLLPGARPQETSDTQDTTMLEDTAWSAGEGGRVNAFSPLGALYLLPSHLPAAEDVQTCAGWLALNGSGSSSFMEMSPSSDSLETNEGESSSPDASRSLMGSRRRSATEATGDFALTDATLNNARNQSSATRSPRTISMGRRENAIASKRNAGQEPSSSQLPNGKRKTPEASNAPLHGRLLRVLLFTVAACLPWSPGQENRWRVNKKTAC